MIDVIKQIIVYTIAIEALVLSSFFCLEFHDMKEELKFANKCNNIENYEK